MNEHNQHFGMHAGAKPELFRFADELRERMTEAEEKLWKYLRKKPLGYKFRRQHPFSLYILDFYCHKAKLAIEFDKETNLILAYGSISIKWFSFNKIISLYTGW